MTRRIAGAFAFAAVLATGGCDTAPSAAVADAPASMVALTIAGASGTHRFSVELANTEQAQEQGLMFRTDIPLDGGMLFAPYPPSGPPRAASFWMKNTPSPLDIIFIRPDGTIARIAENAAPGSEAHIDSGEVVGAVLELRGGRALDLGISEGDRVTWTGRSGK